MKTKRSLVLAITCAALPTFAVAQSSVTLYGRLDAGITYVSNAGGASQYKFDDGVLYGNRWGLKGIEDLGGGLSTVFVLENGFSLGTGNFRQGGAEFGRQAYVGLKNQYGSITMGNQYDFVWDYLGLPGYNLGAFTSGYGLHEGDLDGYLGRRLQNSIKFSSADFNGFRGGALYSFSNVAGNFHQGSSWSAGASYNHGDFSAGAAYTRLNNPSGVNGLDPYAQLGVTSLLGQTVAVRNPTTGVVTDSFANAPFNVDKQTVAAIGASYVIDKLTVASTITNTQLNGYGNSDHLRVYEVGGQYNFTPTFFTILSYEYNKLESEHWNQVSAGFGYQISKRTLLYAGGDYVKASSQVNAVIGNSFAPSSNDHQADIRAGMYTTF
jgi:outer membrane protein OmpU